MITHNKCFYEEINKIIPLFSLSNDPSGELSPPALPEMSRGVEKVCI